MKATPVAHTPSPPQFGSQLKVSKLISSPRAHRGDSNASKRRQSGGSKVINLPRCLCRCTDQRLWARHLSQRRLVFCVLFPDEVFSTDGRRKVAHWLFHSDYGCVEPSFTSKVHEAKSPARCSSPGRAESTFSPCIGQGRFILSFLSHHLFLRDVKNLTFSSTKNFSCCLMIQDKFLPCLCSVKMANHQPEQDLRCES